MKINIIVLNYNGKDLLAECLPSIVESTKNTRFPAIVTILDNCSTDNSIQFLKENFPEVRIFPAFENRVFCSFLQAAQELDEQIIILLNNDIKVEKGFIDPLAEVFMAHKDVFFVSPKCLKFDKKKFEAAKSRWWIEKGMFRSTCLYPGYEEHIDKQGYNLQTGFGAFSREKFLELNGYDSLFLPGIMEDADLCFRAWRKGYKGYYEPKSIVYHKGQVSFKKAFGEKKIMELAHRNTFLFMWKNLSSARIWISHFFWLPIRLVYALLSGNPEFISGFLKALPRLPQALSRRRPPCDYVLSDKDLFIIAKSI